MNEHDCRRVRDLLPERAARSLDGPTDARVEAHLEVCPECRDEADFVAELRRARPRAPEGVVNGVLDAARDQAESGDAHAPWRSRFAAPRRHVAVAATAVLAMAAGVLWVAWADGTEEDPPRTAGVQGSEEELLDDWVVAGEPLLGELPEEVLLALLEEMDE